MTGRLAPKRSLSNDRQVTGRIYSVGYEGLELEALVEHLASAKVSLLVDVRLNPVSRRRGYSRKTLSATLAAAGIEYRHERALGNPQDNRDSFRSGDGEEGRHRMPRDSRQRLGRCPPSPHQRRARHPNRCVVCRA